MVENGALSKVHMVSNKRLDVASLSSEKKRSRQWRGSHKGCGRGRLAQQQQCTSGCTQDVSPASTTKARKSHRCHKPPNTSPPCPSPPPPKHSHAPPRDLLFQLSPSPTHVIGSPSLVPRQNQLPMPSGQEKSHLEDKPSCPVAKV